MPRTCLRAHAKASEISRQISAGLAYHETRSRQTRLNGFQSTLSHHSLLLSCHSFPYEPSGGPTMDRVKPDPDKPASPSLARYPSFLERTHSLVEEAKFLWSVPNEPIFSQNLLQAVQQELRSPPDLRFIQSVNTSGPWIALRCSFALSMGMSEALDAGRIALFGMINAVPVREDAWDVKEHFATLSADSVRYAQRHGVDPTRLREYLIARTATYTPQQSQALLQIVHWAKPGMGGGDPRVAGQIQ